MKLKYSRSETTTLYHLIVTKHSRTDNVDIEELRSVKQYLRHQGVKFISSAYHNDGRYGDLHLHALVWYKGYYSKLKFPYFNLRWETLRSTPDNLLKYIHRGSSRSFRKLRNDQIIEYNQHKISDVFLSTDWYQDFQRRNLII